MQLFLEVKIMTRHIISFGMMLALLVVAWPAAAQDEQKAGQAGRLQNIRERWQNMSEEEKEKFRAEMRDRRDNLSPEEREKLRSQMRDRFNAGPAQFGRQEQLEAIKVIEEQVAKLKAALEVSRPEITGRPADITEEQRAKMREQMMTAMRDRQAAIRAIDEQLEKLRGPVRPSPEPPARMGELKQIYDLAVKENATETAKRIERLMASYRGPLPGQPGSPMEPRPRGDVPRPPRERPPMPSGARDTERGR